jgi:hypothetical protein
MLDYFAICIAGDAMAHSMRTRRMTREATDCALAAIKRINEWIVARGYV